MTEQDEYDVFIDILTDLIKEVEYESNTTGYFDNLSEKKNLKLSVTFLKKSKEHLRKAKIKGEYKNG